MPDGLHNFRAIAMLGLALFMAALFGACAAPGPPLPPSLQLPKPVNDLRAIRKGDKVYLAWSLPVETTDRQSLRHLGATRICRSVEDRIGQCGTPAGEVATAPLLPAPPARGSAPAAKIPVTYIDVLPADLARGDPPGMLTYAVETLNESNRSAGLSNQVSVTAAATVAPPADFSATLTSDGVVLSWSPVPGLESSGAVRHLYRIYRRQAGTPADKNAGDKVAAEIVAGVSAPERITDHGFEWEKSYDYRLTVVTLVERTGKSDLQVEGDDSPTVHVVAHDTFPPAVPTGVQAVFSGAGQAPFIDLVWAPDVEEDLAGYNVYRHLEGAPPAKLNTDLVKAPAYKDTAVEAGKRYFYSIAAVDLRGNESERSEETAESTP